MPGFSKMPGTPSIPPFSDAVTQTIASASNTSIPPSHIIEHILILSAYLIKLGTKSTLFGTSKHDPFSPSLLTLHTRLHTGYLSPCTLPSQFLTEAHIQASTQPGRVSIPAAQRPLADYEDIFYALLARMREMSQLLTLRLDSGFNAPTDTVYEGGPTIAVLHESLVAFWDVLNEPGCGRTLDDAVRRHKIIALEEEVLKQVQSSELSPRTANAHVEQLWSADVYEGVLGLDWTADWAPALVAAKLDEKYRGVLGRERVRVEEMKKEERKRKREMVLMEKKRVMFELERRDERKGEEVARSKMESGGQMEGHRQQYPVLQHEGRVQQEAELQRAREEAIEWRRKTQRVSAYTQYLRDRASHSARYLVDQSKKGALRGLGQEDGRKDAYMADM